MKLFLILLISKFSFAQNQQCLQLNGHWSGDCLYQSEQYGNLGGEIEFQFHQNSCTQISINGNLISIPGSYEKEEVSGFDKTRTQLDLSWQDYHKNQLNYNYQYYFVNNGTIKDEVKLKGYFFMRNGILNLVQKGSVDRDKVKILCQLRLSR